MSKQDDMAYSSAEKRKGERHKVTDFVVAVFAERIEQVINIGESGLALHLVDDDVESLPEKCTAFFVSKGRGFLIDDLPLRLVRKEAKPPPHISTVAAEFDASDANKLDRIKEYISSFS